MTGTATRSRTTTSSAPPALSAPTTQANLTDDLRFLGVQAGELLLVHSSLRALGFVVGGAQAVVGALLDAVGPTGTLVVPTHSDSWSEPSHWGPSVPEGWWETIRASTPPYHPRITPTTHMGAIVECMRRWPGFMRSWHPRVSFGAIGPAAESILADHALPAGFGERSPLGRLYECEARILLLGVGHANSSALHLAEHRAMWPTKRWITQGASLSVDNSPSTSRGRWTEWRELDHDATDFDAIGEAIGAAGLEEVGEVAAGVARLMSLRAVVDLATEWIAAHRR